jgi:hypothetical protein
MLAVRALKIPYLHFLFFSFFLQVFFFKIIIIMGRRPLLPSKNRGRGFGENGNHSW